MELLTVVALRQALPEHNLPAGMQGTVVELLDDSTVRVEFADADGVALCIVPVAVARLERPDTTSGSLTVESSSGRSVQLGYVIIHSLKIIVVTARTRSGNDIISPDALISLADALFERHQIVAWDTDTDDDWTVRSEWCVRHSFAHQSLKVRLVQPNLGDLAVEIFPPETEEQAFAMDLANLAAGLLRWRLYRRLRTPGGRLSLNAIRKSLRAREKSSPRLAMISEEPRWLTELWEQARAAGTTAAARKLGATCPWTLEQILEIDWFPK